jgi:hypothetical protein
MEISSVNFIHLFRANKKRLQKRNPWLGLNKYIKFTVEIPPTLLVQSSEISKNADFKALHYCLFEVSHFLKLRHPPSYILRKANLKYVLTNDRLYGEVQIYFQLKTSRENE